MRKKQEFTDFFIQEDGSTLELDSKMQKRNWFLCVNKKAECYKNLYDIVEFLNGDSQRFYHYAVILHDKDTITKKAFEKYQEEVTSKVSMGLFDTETKYELLPEGERTPYEYAYKPEHYHVLLCFQDAKTWSFIKRHFQGAHVQTCISVANCFHYLIHDTKQCREMGKPVYDLDKVFMSKGGLEFFKAKPVDEMQFRYFNPHFIAKYVFIDGLRNYCDFTLEFSAVQVQRWMGSINSMCNLFKELTLSMQSRGDYCGTRKFCYYDSEGLHFVTDKEINKYAEMNASSVKLDELVAFKDYINNLILTPFGEQVYKIACMCNYEFSSIERYLIWKCLPRYAEKFNVEKCELALVTEGDVGIYDEQTTFTLRVVND